MWAIMWRWGWKLGLIGVAVAIVLTACALEIDDPRHFWQVVTVTDYLFPAHRLILAAPGSSRVTLLVTYLAGFSANAVLYAFLGFGAGGVLYALKRVLRVH